MKTLLPDATALGPAGSRRLAHCAKIKNGTGGSIVMHVFKGKELAIDAACGLLNRGYSDALEVGPMLGTRKGNLFKEQDIQRIRDNTPGASTLESAAAP